MDRSPLQTPIGKVSVRNRGKGSVGAKPKADVIADILAAIRERRS